MKSRDVKCCLACSSDLLSRLLGSFQVPFEDLSEDTLALLLNHIAVAGNDALKVPLVNPGDALVECRSIS